MAPSGSIESRLAGWAKQGVRRHFVAQASHESFHRKGFLERLSLAEARDMAGSAAMQRSALALDELMFDGDSDEDEDSFVTTQKKAHGGVVLPTVEEIEKVAQIFWETPAVERQRQRNWASMTDTDVNVAHNL